MKKSLVSTLLMIVVVTLHAQWSGDPSVGTLVSTSSVANSKTGNVAVTDGAGGMFVAWIDTRFGLPNTVYIQRILANGTAKFGSDVVVSNASVAGASSKSNLAMVSDGGGGVICVWQDARNTGGAYPLNSDIYGQRIDANGNVLWTANGVRMSAADNSVSNKTVPVIDVVNATEAIVVFDDTRNDPAAADLYAQKILLSSGAPQWPNDASVHGFVADFQDQQKVANDGAGGLYIVWQDQRAGASSADVYAQHINNSGSIVSGWGTNGTVVANGSNVQFLPHLLSLGTSGFITSWADARTGAGQYDVYAQRFSAAGLTQWTPNPLGGQGVLIADNTSFAQFSPFIIASSTGYSILVWSDTRNGSSNRDIYAQRIDNSTGAAQWTTYGVQVTSATGNQPASSTESGISIVSDGSDGAVVVWDDSRNTSSNLDIYAQRISSSGTLLWSPSTGLAISTATGSQVSPVAVPTVSNGVLVSWRDSRNGNNNSEIYAARVQPGGTLPVRALTLMAVAKGSSIDVKWNTVDESGVSFFSIEKSVDGALFSAIGTVKATGKGNGSYLLEDKLPTKGTNFYRVKCVDINKSYAYSGTAAVNFNGGVKTSLVIYPNPVEGLATLQLNNLANGIYVLTVRDLAGRVLVRQSLPITNNYQQTTLSLQGLGAGSYLVQVEGNKAKFSTQVQKK